MTLPAPVVSDREADQDLLRRLPFARLLADQLTAEYDRISPRGHGPDSFMVHLDGHWGSGKSTLLNLLAQELCARDPPWLVARFNAWRHQQVGPPWWLLIKVIYREALRTVPWRNRPGLWLENAWWRAKLAWQAFAAAAVVAAVLTTLALTGKLSSNDPLGVSVGALSAVAGAILSIRGLASGLSVGSVRGADAFIRSTRDPMGALRRRHQVLVHRITKRIGRPLIVFIDDLDRCRSDYVVDLLEGIQTTLRNASITYVIAANRRWLYESYSEIYSAHESPAVDPGRPLGHLFLEKSFQLSASVPRLGTKLRGAYLTHLLESDQLRPASPDPEEQPPLPEDPSQIEADENRILELASSAAKSRSQTYLRHFSHLIDDNPRAIKRLLNAYRPALAVEILEGRGDKDARQNDQFVLWLIINLRWPLLADYLVERPEAADELAAPGTDVPPAIAADQARPYLACLAQDASVREVIQGKGLEAELRTDALRWLLGD